MEAISQTELVTTPRIVPKQKETKRQSDLTKRHLLLPTTVRAPKLEILCAVVDVTTGVVIDPSTLSQLVKLRPGKGTHMDGILQTWLQLPPCGVKTTGLFGVHHGTNRLKNCSMAWFTTLCPSCEQTTDQSVSGVAIFLAAFHPIQGKVLDHSDADCTTWCGTLCMSQFHPLPSLHLPQLWAITMVILFILNERQISEYDQGGFFLPLLNALLVHFPAFPCPWHHTPALKVLVGGLQTGPVPQKDSNSEVWLPICQFFKLLEAGCIELGNPGTSYGWNEGSISILTMAGLRTVDDHMALVVKAACLCQLSVEMLRVPLSIRRIGVSAFSIQTAYNLGKLIFPGAKGSLLVSDCGAKHDVGNSFCNVHSQIHLTVLDRLPSPPAPTLST
ncbi:hypothetical protein V8E53_007585 [Lactarius tabidus]